jgi:hypothetical protein
MTYHPPPPRPHTSCTHCAGILAEKLPGLGKQTAKTWFGLEK